MISKGSRKVILLILCSICLGGGWSVTDVNTTSISGTTSGNPNTSTTKSQETQTTWTTHSTVTSTTQSPKTQATQSTVTGSTVAPEVQVSLFIYFLVPGVCIIICAGCGMRYKYRKSKPWAHAHHLRRQVAYLKQGMPVRRPSDGDMGNGRETTTAMKPTPPADQNGFTNIAVVVEGPV